MTKERLEATRRAENFMVRMKTKNKKVHWCCDECPVQLSADVLLWLLVEHELEVQGEVSNVKR